EADGQAAHARPGAPAAAPAAAGAARPAAGRPRLERARSAPAPPAHARRCEALALTREPGAAIAVGVRGPALDRCRDPGVTRRAGGQPADRARAAARELPAGVRAHVAPQDVLPRAAAGSPAAGERGGAARGAAERRAGDERTEAAAGRAHGGQSLLPRGERP